MVYKSYGFEIILNGCGQCPYTGKESLIRISDNIRLYVDEYGSFRFVYYTSRNSKTAISAIQIMKDERGAKVANVITVPKYRQKGYAKTLFSEAKKYLNAEIIHSINLSELGKIFAKKVN